MRHHWIVLTHMVSFGFLIQKPSVSQDHMAVGLLRQYTSNNKKTFQRAAMEYSRGKLAAVRRLCMFEGYFRQ